MVIDVSMKPGFMYLGVNTVSLTQEVPMPNGGAPFTTTYRLRTQESADGSLAGQKIGRSRATQEMVWQRMDCTTWWALNQWLETNGPAFYCRYFDYNYGQWRTRHFYVTQVSCSPYRPGAASGTSHGQPEYLTNASLVFYDLGE